MTSNMQVIEKMIIELKPVGEIKDAICSARNSTDYYVNDENKDLLHCAIEAYYHEVVDLLLQDFKWPAFEQRNVPHLHLAAKLGRAPLINVLLKHKPQNLTARCNKSIILDNDVDSVSFSIKPAEAMKLDDTKFPVDISVKVPNTLSALDVAAIYKKHKCVANLLLNRNTSRTAQTLISKAVVLNNPLAVAFLLETVKSKEEWTNAFDLAVKHKHAHCLDILLLYNPAFALNFQGVNPYYIMYLQSSGFPSFYNELEVDRHYLYQNLPECTTVLLKHNVNTFTPPKPGFYALHCAIESLANHVENNTEVDKDGNVSYSQDFQYHFETIKILLNSGQAANFDEYVHMQEMPDEYYRINALHVLFNCGKYLCGDCTPKITKLLLDYQACSPTEALNQFLHEIYKDHYVYHTPWLFWKDVCRVLLMYGADASKALNEIAPIICIYNEFYVDLNESRCYEPLSYIYMYSDSGSKMRNRKKIMSYYMGKTYPWSLKNIQCLEQIVGTVYSLQLHCKNVIWRAVGRNKENISKLDLPVGLTSSILTMFDT